jgi:2,5-furandicarboxylate decarboxylase 1
VGANHLSDLGRIIDDLDAMGRITRVTSETDLRHDLAGIAARFEGGPRAVLFENVKDHEQPVFTGLYWSRELLGALMRREPATLPQFVSDCIKRWQQNPVPPEMVRSGPVFEVTEPQVDLFKMPIPVHALDDGGPYFDAGVVIARDPQSGIRNASIQRFMVVDKNTLHVNIDAGRHLELYLNKARELQQTLTFSINCGVGPGLHFAAATPAEAAPPDTDELGIASEFHGAPLALAEGKRLPVHLVPSAMYALECEIIPDELGEEGPFAEVTGYYAKRAPRPVVHVRAIHRRARPVFQTILSGVEV